MNAIHGGKIKNDRIDSRKIAGLIRAGMIPMSYVYPAEMWATRDLLRRHNHDVQQSIAVDLDLIDHYNPIITNLVRYFARAAKNHNSQAFNLLETIYGIVYILALVIFSEIHEINRFPRVQEFVSHVQLVK